MKREKSAAKKSEKPKDVPMEVIPSTSGVVKQTKSKKSAKSKKSTVDIDDSGELLLESLMWTEKMETEDNPRDEFGML